MNMSPELVTKIIHQWNDNVPVETICEENNIKQTQLSQLVRHSRIDYGGSVARKRYLAKKGHKGISLPLLLACLLRSENCHYNVIKDKLESVGISRSAAGMRTQISELTDWNEVSITEDQEQRAPLKVKYDKEQKRTVFEGNVNLFMEVLRQSLVEEEKNAASKIFHAYGNLKDFNGDIS